ncbi:MAG: ElyC/SanA/YdcF family protein [Bacillota bacterium]|nr:ElyC/SanA/YdcF family protein [Bacillota bacterium]
MIIGRKKKGILRRIFSKIIKLAILIFILVIGVNLFVVKSTEDEIKAVFDSDTDTLQVKEMSAMKSLNADCIMVLGASVNPDGTPSPMLQDRLDMGIALYHAGAAPKLLLSGDNGQVVYNEVATMKSYAMGKGVPEEDIFLDHAGFSTYESVYRADYIFHVKRMIVVTQKYHLYRALYGCRRMGIEALGAASDQETYRGQEYREIREILARDKDFVKWMIKPEPTFLGEVIPISGSGISSH